MELDEKAEGLLKEFNSELASLYETKPPISKAKMMQITKGAIKAIKYYKHVVLGVEKFIQKCKPEYKVPGLYVIDSIVRQSRHQFGAEKDVFGPRFARNFSETFGNLMKCPSSDRQKLGRVLSLWNKNAVFTEAVTAPIAALIEGTPLSESSFVTPQGTPAKKDPTPAHTPSKSDLDLRALSGQTQGRDSSDGLGRLQEIQRGFDTKNIDPAILQQIEALTSQLLKQQNVVQEDKSGFTKVLSKDYEYSDDEDDQDQKIKINDATRNLFGNQDLMQQLRTLQQAGHPLPVTIGGAPAGFPTLVQALPNSTHIPPGAVSHPAANQFPSFSSPPPGYSAVPQQHHLLQQQQKFLPVASQQSQFVPFKMGVQPQKQPVADIPAFSDSQNSNNCPPPAEPLPPGLAAQQQLDRDERRSFRDRDDRGSSQDKDDRNKRRRKRRSHSRSRSRDRGTKRQHSNRSRSRSRSRSRKQSRRSSRSPTRRSGDKDRERRKQGWPSLKSKHLTVCSRTLWFGRIVATCEPNEIVEPLKQYGEPIVVDIIAPRGCAYVVMPDRRAAFKVLDRLQNNLRIQGRDIKMAWAPGKGVKEAYKDYWDAESGSTYIPIGDLKPDVDFSALVDGGQVDPDSIPEHLKGKFAEAQAVAANDSSKPPSTESSKQPTPQPAPSMQIPPGYPPGQGLPPGFPPGFPVFPRLPGGAPVMFGGLPFRPMMPLPTAAGATANLGAAAVNAGGAAPLFPQAQVAAQQHPHQQQPGDQADQMNQARLMHAVQQQQQPQLQQQQASLLQQVALGQGLPQAPTVVSVPQLLAASASAAHAQQHAAALLNPALAQQLQAQQQLHHQQFQQQQVQQQRSDLNVMQAQAFNQFQQHAALAQAQQHQQQQQIQQMLQQHGAAVIGQASQPTPLILPRSFGQQAQATPLPLVPPGFQPQNERQRFQGGGGNARDGGKKYNNWDCPHCGNNNFAFRVECNKCKAPKGDAGESAESYSGGGGRGDQRGRGGGRAENWQCSYCFVNNFAHRESCFKCKRPKHLAVAQSDESSASFGGSGGNAASASGYHASRFENESNQQGTDARPSRRSSRWEQRNNHNKVVSQDDQVGADSVEAEDQKTEEKMPGEPILENNSQDETAEDKTEIRETVAEVEGQAQSSAKVERNNIPAPEIVEPEVNEVEIEDNSKAYGSKGLGALLGLLGGSE